MSTAFDVGICDKIVLDKFQIKNSFGSNHDNIVADGSGGCSWGAGSFGGIVQPLVAPLDLGGQDMVGKGQLKAPLSIPQPADDVFPDPPNPPYLGGTKYKMLNGFSTGAYRQSFQSNFGGGFFPSNADGMMYFNKALIQGFPLATIGRINLGSGVAQGVEQNIPIGGQGATDSSIYDPFNTRTGIVGSTYTACGLNKSLSGCGGVYDADIAKVNVKINVDYDLFFNLAGGEAQVIIRVRPPPVINTGVLSTDLLLEAVIDLDLNSVGKTRTQGCRHFLFPAYDLGWKVGSTIEVFIKPTLNNLTTGHVDTSFYISPAC